MRNLPNLKLTQQQLSSILERKLDYGGESYICLGTEGNTLYKLFRNPNYENFKIYDPSYIPSTSEIIQMSDNKFQKLQKLHEMQLKHAVLPLRTISLDKELIGYEMIKKTNMSPIWLGIMSKEERVYYLNQIRKILNYFAKHDITYGDVKDRNILHSIVSGEIVFCDMDNIRIGENPIDIADYELDFYLKNGGSEEHIDAYMHSLMTLEALQLCLDDINENPKTFSQHFQKKSIPIIKTLINPQDYRGEYISQYIKKRRG